MSIIHPTLNLVARPGVSPPQAMFTRASTATRVGPNGLVETVASNVLRHDYDPSSGEYLGWLIEGQRTNAYTYSGDFSHADWTKTGCSVSADTAAGPDGTMTADKLVEDGSTGPHFVLQQPIIPAGNASYVASVFAKAAGRAKVVLSLSNSASYVNGAPSITFDLSAGTVGSVSAGVIAYGSTSYGNGWYRVWIAGTTTASPSGVTGGVVALHNATGTGYAGDGASGVLLWGAQLEAGAFASSYIPTTTAAATRNAEVMTVAASGLIPSTEYTMFANFVLSHLEPTSNVQNVLTVSDGSTNNFTSIRKRFGGNNIGVETSGTTNAWNVTLAAAAEGSEYKVAASFKASDFGAVVNGGAESVAVNGTMPTVTTINIGGGPAGIEFLNGHFKHVAIFPRALAAADGQTITE